MTVSKKSLIFAVAAVAALSVAACSSSGGNSSGGSTSAADTGSADTTTSSAAASGGGSSSSASGSPIVVGAICSCTGPISTSAAPAGNVVQAWAKSVNASGGIDGHPINLVFKDDGSDPGKAVTAAQDLISAHVDVIIDSSILDSAWAKAVDQANIPVVGGNLSSSLYFTDPNFYPAGQTNDSIVYADALTAKQSGATKLGQLYCVESPSCQEGVEPHKQAGQKLGVPFVYTASISGTAPNYTAQCLAAKQAGVQALFIGDSPQVFARVATDCQQQGYQPTYIEEGTAYTTKLGSTPALNNHYWADYPILPFFVNKPAVQKMNAALDKYAPGVRTNADAFSEFAPQAWTASLLVEKAIEKSGAGASTDLTPDLVRKGLDSLKNETLDGWSPPLTFHAGQKHSVDCWYTAEIKNGKSVLANGGRLSCQNGQNG